MSNEFSPSGSIYTSFDGIVKKLLECLDDEVDIQQAKSRKSKIAKEDLFKYMESFFTRPLSPLEYDVIQMWKNKNYDFVLIKAACEIAAQTGNKSIRYIDTIIFEENKKNEIGAEEYQKREQETIELSTVDWLNK